MGRVTASNIRQAIAALHHQGLCILENVFEADIAQGIQIYEASQRSPDRRVSFFTLNQFCESPICLGPLLAQIASVRLGTPFETPKNHQKRSLLDNYSLKSKERDAKQMSNTPMAALSIGIVLDVAKLCHELQQSSKEQTSHRFEQKLWPGSIVVWAIQKSRVEIIGSIKGEKRNSVAPPVHNAAWIQTFVGMRNFRCLQCNVFNLNIAKHIKTCPANNV